MPKLGRRNNDTMQNCKSENTELDYQWQTPVITRNAPFGTQDTPTIRTKIIGGKRVTVYEDNKYSSPRRDEPLERRHGAPPSQGGSRESTPLKLAPLTEKPNYFNPQPFLQRQSQTYNSAVPDGHNSQRHSPELRAVFSPHRVVPPISQPQGGHDLTRHLPIQGYLPSKSIQLNKGEELELRQRVYDDLTSFDSKKLKDVYLELTGHDRNLSGFINYTDLGLVLMRFQVNISADNLRLVASLFIDESRDPGIINYERVLSFISSSLKPLDNERQRLEGSEPPPEVDRIHTDEAFYNPVAFPTENQLATKPNAPRDDSRLLKLVEQQLLVSADDVDFENIWQVFRSADRQHRGKMARDQIKSLAYRCRIPLQESLVNQVVDKCDSSNGQYDWQQFLAFLERVQPAHTGLIIPESKRPTEYVKHYPVPSNNWPLGSDKNAVRASPRMQSPRKPFSYLDTDDPDSVLGYDHPKYGRVNEESREVETRKPPALKDSQADLDHELDDLRKSHEAAKNKIIDEKTQKMRKADWFERYMKLAQALYDLDDEGTGHLPADRVNWAVERFNDAYMLDLPMQIIPQLMQQNTIAGNISIDPFLKSLGARVL